MAVGESARARGGGSGRLLHDCAALGRMVAAAERPPARERLDSEVGDRLAALLLSALTGDQTLGRDPGIWSPPSETGRIVVLHPERSTAVSLGMSRSRKQRMVSPVGGGETRRRKAAFNERRRHETGASPAAAERIELSCECDDEACPARIALTRDEYAFLRTVPSYYAVAPDHVRPDDHVIVGQADRYAIVE